MLIPNPFFLLPSFVSITMTPFDARVPYNAAALGPLSTETEAMSSGFTSIAPFPKSTS